MKAEVYFDCELRLSETIDLQGEIFTGSSEVWWGFTGATGGASNEQTVCISEFALGLEPEYQMCLGMILSSALWVDLWGHIHGNQP